MNKGEFPMEIVPLGESAIQIKLGKSIHPDIHRRVKMLLNHLEKHPFPGMIECIPAFASVTVFYDPLKVRMFGTKHPELTGRSAYEIVSSMLKEMAVKMGQSVDSEPRVVEIPVCYGGEFGPDLDDVAAYNQMKPEEVIAIHSGATYLVYMIGFAPGFPYLGEMPKEIATPRRPSPRPSIPQGSVGIAGMQTGIYPISTPGGWQLIGRTPLQLFRPDANPPSLLQSGDFVKFRSISREEFEQYREESR